MGQVLLVCIALIVLKLLWDVYKEHFQKPKTDQAQRGKVIDISDAWVDMTDLPYKKQNSLLSGRDLTAYEILQETFDSSSFAIFPKVRLADFVVVDKTASNRNEYYNRIKERSVSFLICKMPEMNPVLIIQTEEHREAKKHQLTERFTRKVAEAADIPILILNLTDLPSADELKKELNALSISI